MLPTSGYGTFQIFLPPVLCLLASRLFGPFKFFVCSLGMGLLFNMTCELGYHAFSAMSILAVGWGQERVQLLRRKMGRAEAHDYTLWSNSDFSSFQASTPASASPHACIMFRRQVEDRGGWEASPRKSSTYNTPAS